MRGSPRPVYFSIVIPAHDEEDCIEHTCEAIVAEFERRGIADYEIVAVNDDSKDRTETLLQGLARRFPTVRYVNNPPPHGFGFAVRRGLGVYRGDVVCIVMADLSESPEDIVAYYLKSREGWDCIFGSRFMTGSKVADYPRGKWVLNRLANRLVQLLFWVDTNDITNPFKCYRRKVIDGVQPLVAEHFDLEFEIPLKAIVRGYKWAKMPISWTNRDAGQSKFHVLKLAGPMIFMVLRVFCEKWRSRESHPEGMRGV